MRSIAILVLSLAWATACQNVSKLDPWDPGREVWQRPGDVIAALEIRPGDRVADVGAGDGYFLPYLRDAVGESGRVYAVDVDAERVEVLAKHFAARDGSIEAILGRDDDPELPDAEIDLVLLVNTYHHIEDRPDYFERLRADLSSKGRVAILEPNESLGGVLSLFLKDGHTSLAEDIAMELRQAGYERAKSFDFLPVQIFEVYAPGR